MITQLPSTGIPKQTDQHHSSFSSLIITA